MAGVSGDAVQFLLSPTTSLVIQKGDITMWSIDGASDAIVCKPCECSEVVVLMEPYIELPVQNWLKLVTKSLKFVPTADAKITPGFKFPASHVIHTVGPIYNSDGNPQESLRHAYRNSLIVAKENGIKYIAFPAISCGVYGYPYDEAAGIAISTVKEFSDGLKEVHFVLFSEDIYSVWLQKARDSLQKYKLAQLSALRCC